MVRVVSIEIAVIPCTVAHIDALVEGDDAFEARFGWRVVPGYLDFPEVLGPSRQTLVDGGDPAWHSQLFVDPTAGELIGFGGFKGPPRDGEVEIGYSIAPGRRRRGFATAAALAMIEVARAAGVDIVVAQTLPEPNASTRVLERCGFVRAGAATDPQVGDVWRWELRVNPP
jgi:[ribosomal protein S5]-alanine N-acetyltransferase